MTKSLLKNTHPELLKEWDYERNTHISINTITTNNPKKAHWVCAQGHKWETNVSERTKGTGCPYCTNRKVLTGFNDLATVRPDLTAEWHPTKNTPLTPETVVYGTARNVWWKCEKGHEWEAKVSDRILVKNPSCPFCIGQRVLAGFNDLESNYPEVAKEWFSAKNNVSTLEVFKHSSKKFWWKGECGHEWLTSVYMRTVKNSGCTKCRAWGGNRLGTPKVKPKAVPKGKTAPRVVKGVNDLATVKPEVAKLYNEKKNELKLEDVAAFSQRVVWWKCEKGHEWERRVAQQSRRSTKCPFCAGQRLDSGFNDLAILHPRLAAEWDAEKNGIEASDMLPSTTVKYWWKCKKEHEWENDILARIHGRNCPYCANRRVVVGENDLVTFFPELASQYHPSKNKKKIGEVVSSSGVNVWWKCDKGHEWENTPYNRTYNRDELETFVGNGCPVCVPPKVSQAELEVLEYIKSLGFENVVSNDRTVLDGQELDIYLPDLKIGVEYNGLYWHTEKQGRGQSYHLGKWQKAQTKGVQLLQIWEDDWRDKKPLWKRMLAVKLGVGDTSGKVFARNTELAMYSYGEVREYMDANHLQGAMFGSAYVGLKDKTSGELVALLVVTMKENETVMELTRFMSSVLVPGGFSKLLKHVLNLYPNTRKVISFSENSISDGNLYLKMGFVDEASMNAYSYLSTDVPVRRIHRRHFTKKKYESRSDLEFREGLTERELADLNGLDRVWEAGNTRWVKYV